MSNYKIYFDGTGKDPRSMHTYSVEISGENLTQLTKEKGVHRTKLSPDNKYLIDQWSNAETPGITQIISLKNSRRNIVHQAENPLKDIIIGGTEMIELSEKTDQILYGRLIKPSNFDASKKYPVLITQCKKCLLVQLKYSVPDKLLFPYNYSYPVSYTHLTLPTILLV